MIDNDFELEKSKKLIRKGIYTTIEGIIATGLMIWLVVISDEGTAKTLTAILLMIAIIVLFYGIILIILGHRKKNKKKIFLEIDNNTKEDNNSIDKEENEYVE